MEILKVEHLTKVYGEGETATRALDDVSFSVEEGEFIAIIGSSGSGKSTLLHLIGGVDRPTSGSVLLNGVDVYSRSDEELAVFRRREVGLVYQFYNLVPVLNVVENMTLPGCARWAQGEHTAARVSSDPSFASWSRRASAAPTLWWTATACGDRPCAHECAIGRAR